MSFQMYCERDPSQPQTRQYLLSAPITNSWEQFRFPYSQCAHSGHRPDMVAAFGKN